MVLTHRSDLENVGINKQESERTSGTMGNDRELGTLGEVSLLIRDLSYFV